MNNFYTGGIVSGDIPTMIDESNYLPRELLEGLIARAAQRFPNTFIESVITDEVGDLLKQRTIHSKVQKFLIHNIKGVIKLPREHGKTTQVMGHCAWLIGNDPNIRIKIVSSSDGLAIGKGKAIRETLESSSFREVFPDIIPGREWTNQKFSIRRSIISPESTVECFGLHSKATGGRADFILFDDPDDEEVVVSEARRTRNWERVSNVWLNLLQPNGKAFIICTPWHRKDIAHQLENNSKWPVLSIPIIGTDPIWPERWSKEKLTEKLKDIASLAYGRGYNLKVMSDEDRPIKGEWFRYWTRLPEKFSTIGIAVDPAIGERKVNDFTVIGLFGVTSKHEVYLLRVIRKRMDFPTSISTIIKVAERAELEYGMKPSIGIEDAAFQKALPQQLKRETAYKIIGLKASTSKFIRASRCSVHVENGRVLLQGKNSETVHSDQKILYDECVDFPAAEHDDCVDMLGYGVEMMLSQVKIKPLVFGGGKEKRK